MIEEGHGDARELLADVRSKRNGKARFPLLRGPKIAPLWVRIMAAPGGAAISQMETIPVAVDMHVRRVTENLGVTDTHGLALDRNVKRRIQSAWQDAVSIADFGGPQEIAGNLRGSRSCSLAIRRSRLQFLQKASPADTHQQGMRQLPTVKQLEVLSI